jgi:hypothetical protein
MIYLFQDGNGRLGRLLVMLALYNWDLLPGPYLYPSSYFNANRDAYLNRLLAVSRDRTWTEWVLFFVQAIAEQGREAYTVARDCLLSVIATGSSTRAKVSSFEKSSILLSNIPISPNHGQSRRLTGHSRRSIRLSGASGMTMCCERQLVKSATADMKPPPCWRSSNRTILNQDEPDCDRSWG